MVRTGVRVEGGNMKAKKLVIKSKVRFTIFLVVVMLLSVTMLNAIIGFNDVAGSSEKEYISVEVCSGDTLWNIANTYMSETYDTREAVYEICTINDINAADLHEGMILKIPAKI